MYEKFRTHRRAYFMGCLRSKNLAGGPSEAPPHRVA